MCLLYSGGADPANDNRSNNTNRNNTTNSNSNIH